MEEGIDHELVIQRLSSNDPKVVIQAAFDLGDMGCFEAVPDLLRLLSSLTPGEGDALNMLCAIAYAVNELKIQEAKPRLLELIRDPRTKGRRGSFLYAMLDLDCRDDYDFLVEQAFDDFWEVRQKAIMILKEILPFQDLEKLAASRETLLDRLDAIPPDDERSLHVDDLIDMIDWELEDRASGTELP